VIKVPAIEYNVVFAYVFGLILLYFVGWVLLVPLKIIIKLIYNSVLGGIALVLINFFGGFAGIHIGVNPLTALAAGVLGIPGIALLLVLQFVFRV
jgi:inhibitor of the pro-sigma K processing machinery